MPTHSPGSGARPKAAPLMPSRSLAATHAAAALAAILAAVTACSGSSGSHPSGAAAAQSPGASSAAPDAAAAAALHRAETVTAATKSFTFAATEVLSGDTSHATSLRGNVVRGQGVSYVLTANGRTSQVVRVAGATYVRPVPGSWSKLRKPRPVSDPAGTLLAVLRGLAQASVHTDGSTQVVDGTLPAAAAKAAQLPASPTPAHVQVILDAAGHVSRLAISTTSGGTSVTLTTTYATFGQVKPLKAPV
jgi:hypothetical protein